jgi:hypothetical protein
MFRNLPPWEPPGKTETDKIDFIASFAEAYFEPENSENNSFDNSFIPAAYTYFGQFIAHDITFDPISSLQRQNDPDRLYNFRTPRFDLDSIYGRGPIDQPYFYEKNNFGRLLIGKPHRKDNEPQEEDLPRNSEKVALIGDMRNDEHIIISQLQLAFLKFHNKMIERAKQFFGKDKEAVFVEAQRLTRWHYQWVVIHDFVKRLCGPALVDDLLTGSKIPGEPKLSFYAFKQQPFMPVEFSAAAYRFGHSMIRPRYDLNYIVRNRAIFPQDANADPLSHLAGFRELPAFWTVQWNRFVVHARSDPQKSRLIDTNLAASSRTLPPSVTGMLQDPREASLAFRDIQRGWRLGLPSGQAVARHMGLEPVPGKDLPLWIYILKEAEMCTKGQKLGPVGSRIVAEVFVGLLAGDPQSFYRVYPHWTPELDSEGDTFKLCDILRHAGVPMKQGELGF